MDNAPRHLSRRHPRGMPRHKWDPRCPPPRNLVMPVRLDPDGITGPTHSQSRGRRWRRTSYGFYVPATVDGSVPEQRILEQSVRLPVEGVVTGWASCRLLGATFFDGVMPTAAHSSRSPWRSAPPHGSARTLRSPSPGIDWTRPKSCCAMESGAREIAGGFSTRCAPRLRSARLWSAWT